MIDPKSRVLRLNRSCTATILDTVFHVNQQHYRHILYIRNHESKKKIRAVTHERVSESRPFVHALLPRLHRQPSGSFESRQENCRKRRLFVAKQRVRALPAIARQHGTEIPACKGLRCCCCCRSASSVTSWQQRRHFKQRQRRRVVVV